MKPPSIDWLARYRGIPWEIARFRRIPVDDALVDGPSEKLLKKLPSPQDSFPSFFLSPSSSSFTTASFTTAQPETPSPLDRGRPSPLGVRPQRLSPQPYENRTKRGFTIKGPAYIVTEVTLYQLWHGYFDYHTDEVLTVGEYVDNSGVTIRRVIWRFGSHRAQVVKPC